MAIGVWLGGLNSSPVPAEEGKEEVGLRSRSATFRSGSAVLEGGHENPRARLIEEKNQELLEGLQSNDPEEVIRIVREMLEYKYSSGVRMSLVCDVLALMSEENAGDIKAAFDQSWADGFNYEWERQLFIDRYGEIAGVAAVEAYPSGMSRHRAISGWARENPDEAIDWVNQLEEGSLKNDSIGSIMWSLTNDNPDYTLQVFRAFSQEEQANRIGDLISVTRRHGGSQAAAALAEDLRTSESEEDRFLAKGAYRSTFKIFQDREPEKMAEWLAQLPVEALSLLDQRKLPEEAVKRLED